MSLKLLYLVIRKYCKCDPSRSRKEEAAWRSGNLSKRISRTLADQWALSRRVSLNFTCAASTGRDYSTTRTFLTQHPHLLHRRYYANTAHHTSLPEETGNISNRSSTQSHSHTHITPRLRRPLLRPVERPSFESCLQIWIYKQTPPSLTMFSPRLTLAHFNDPLCGIPVSQQ